MVEDSSDPETTWSSPTPLRVRFPRRNTAYLTDRQLLQWFDTEKYLQALKDPRCSVHYLPVEKKYWTFLQRRRPDTRFLNYTCTVELTVTPFLRRVIEYVIDRYGTMAIKKGPVKSICASNDLGQTSELQQWTLLFSSRSGERHLHETIKEALLTMMTRIGAYCTLIKAVSDFVYPPQ